MVFLDVKATKSTNVNGSLTTSSNQLHKSESQPSAAVQIKSIFPELGEAFIAACCEVLTSSLLCMAAKECHNMKYTLTMTATGI